MTEPWYGEQFIEEYFTECDEHLATMRRTLLALESRQDGRQRDAAVSAAHLHALRRALHTVKGLSGMVGLACAERLAHAMEDALRNVSAEETSIGPELLEALFSGTRHLEACIASRRAGEDSSAVEDVLAELGAAAAPATPGPAAPPVAPLAGQRREDPKTPEPPPGNASGNHSLPVPAGTVAYRFEFTPSEELALRGIGVASIRARLESLGDLLEARPRVLDGTAVIFLFRVAVRPGAAPAEHWRNEGLDWSIGDGAMDAATGEEHSPAHNRPSPPPPPAGTARDTVKFATAGSNVVRVDLSRVDALMRIVSELVVTRSRLGEALTHMNGEATGNEWQPLHEANALLERQLRSLREGITRIRLVAIGEVFERLRFAVRDVARESGKEVVLDLSGGDTEIDKLVVDRMLEPLMHLVRNAVSHGIETPEVRRARGKSAEGRLALRASAVGDRICIEVEDDGAGVDVEQVAARARTGGLLAPAEALVPDQVLDVLAVPGFSTREQADLASGRGVGMAVVTGAIRELGGQVAMSTTPGRGTRFAIELPLTLMIVDALLVEVGGQRMAVPQPALREILQVEPATFTRFENNEVIPYREGVLPLVNLRQLFAMSDARPGTHHHALVVGNDTRLAGLLVERLLGLREIVVHPVPDPLVAVPGIAGATELGDGRVSLILDAPALIRMAANRVPASPRSAAPVPVNPIAESRA